MSLAKDFKKALERLERERDAKVILSFFTDDVQLERLTRKDYRGKAGAKTFWEEYLGSFETQTTTFNNTVEGPSVVVLEWISEGTRHSGEPFSYAGVSILEHEDERVQAFRTYYDSAAFVQVEASPS